MTNFLKRIASGIIYVFLFLSATLYSKESYFALITIFGFLCIKEFSKIVKSKGFFSYLIFTGFVILAFLGEISFSGIPILLFICLTGSFQVISFLFFSSKLYPRNPFQKIDISIRYLTLSIVFLLFLPFISETYQPEIIIYLLLIIWSNDSFAYVIGFNFGKNKLFEKVSPKKTIEGFIGGFVFSIITGVLIGVYSSIFSVLEWGILALLTSVLGTLGDLIESKFKRQANIKDSGNIMPGHGGMLDRLDSLLFVAPFVYLYINYII